VSCINCRTNAPCELHAQVCNCIRVNCWHPYKACEEPPKFKGLTCTQCRTYIEPKRCPTCGQVRPEKDEALRATLAAERATHQARGEVMLTIEDHTSDDRIPRS